MNFEYMPELKWRYGYETMFEQFKEKQ